MTLVVPEANCLGTDCSALRGRRSKLSKPWLRLLHEL